MDLHYSAEDLAFRDEVRSFLETSYPDHLRSRASRDEVTKQDFLDWQKILYNRGWGAPAWPKEYGGTGWTPTQQYIFLQECAQAGAPRLEALTRAFAQAEPRIAQANSQANSQANAQANSQANAPPASAGEGDGWLDKLARGASGFVRVRPVGEPDAAQPAHSHGHGTTTVSPAVNSMFCSRARPLTTEL